MISSICVNQTFNYFVGESVFKPRVKVESIYKETYAYKSTVHLLVVLLMFHFEATKL